MPQFSAPRVLVGPISIKFLLPALLLVILLGASHAVALPANAAGQLPARGFNWVCPPSAVFCRDPANVPKIVDGAADRVEGAADQVDTVLAKDKTKREAAPDAAAASPQLEERAACLGKLCQPGQVCCGLQGCWNNIIGCPYES